MNLSADALIGRKHPLTLKLEFCTVVGFLTWVYTQAIGTELGSSARAVYALNDQAVSPAQTHKHVCMHAPKAFVCK